MTRTRRLPILLTDEEAEAYKRAALEDGAGTVATWLRGLAAQRVKLLDRARVIREREWEILPSRAQKKGRAK